MFPSSRRAARHRLSVVRGASLYCVVSIAAAIASCGDPTGPSVGPPGLRIVAGSDVTDSAGALLPQALIVELRNDRGHPLAGAEVRFIAVPYGPTRPSLTEAWSRQIDSDRMSAETVDTTDGGGRARVQVQLGIVAGNARLAVYVPSTGALDTARFTVVPGKPTRVVADVQDTTITASGGFRIDVRVLDGRGNVRGDAVTFSATGEGLSVDASGNVSTTVPTRGFVVATSGVLVDTTRLSVVPPGAFTAVLLEDVADLWLVTLQLDGTGLTKLTKLRDSPARPSWHPSGDLIVFEEDVDPAITEVRLFFINMQGQRRRAVTPGAELVRERTASFSPDGQWLYFDGNSVSYRSRVDGSLTERVPTPPGVTSTWGPNPSPDGLHLAVSGIGIQDLAGTTITRLPIAGIYPRYSPDGNRLLYSSSASALSVVNADGTGARELVSTHGYDPAIPPSWSADGNWILIRGQTRLELVRVANGEIIPLPYAGFLFQPSLKR
jgi:Tol biopolymer transport system component